MYFKKYIKNNIFKISTLKQYENIKIILNKKI